MAVALLRISRRAQSFFSERPAVLCRTIHTWAWWDFNTCEALLDSDIVAGNITAALTKLNYSAPLTVPIYGNTARTWFGDDGSPEALSEKGFKVLNESTPCRRFSSGANQKPPGISIWWDHENATILRRVKTLDGIKRLKACLTSKDFQAKVLRWTGMVLHSEAQLEIKAYVKTENLRINDLTDFGSSNITVQHVPYGLNKAEQEIEKDAIIWGEDRDPSIIAFISGDNYFEKHKTIDRLMHWGHFILKVVPKSSLRPHHRFLASKTNKTRNICLGQPYTDYLGQGHCHWLWDELIRK